MKLIVSLDYELFFGAKTGTVENCLIKPTNALTDAVNDFGVKLSLFVDAGYLEALKREGKKSPELLRSYDTVTSHLSKLSKNGHDIQLHIHPHWEDCSYKNGVWHVDTSRYRLHEFPESEQDEIVSRYKSILEQFSEKPVFAYRAGGWCIQPFSQIKKALQSSKIWLDSTVYYQGKSDDQTRWFDFSSAPDLDEWFFNDDPNKLAKNGEFLEIPISSIKVNPIFFWKLLATKKFMKSDHFKAYGDGAAMVANRSYYLNLLTRYTNSVVSLDGFKAKLIESAFNKYQSEGREIFNIIGHPKAFTPYSIKCFRQFIEGQDKFLEAVTYQHFRN